MSATPGSAPLSRKGTYGLLLILLAGVILAALAVLPFLWRSQIDELKAEKELELRLIESRLAAARLKPGLVLTASDNVDKMFVEGQTTGLAIAEFQRSLNAMASASGIIVERLQPIQTDVGGELTTLRMEVVAAGSIEGLRAYLLALESSLPIVFVNEAELSPKNSRESEYPSESLTLALQVEAYGHRGPAAP